MASHYKPARGATGGGPTRPTQSNVPDFLRLDRAELGVLVERLRDPLATQIYLLVLVHGAFTTGEFLGSYARLMELCTSPGPNPDGPGRRLERPTYKQVRRAVDRLVELHLLTRNATRNANQGQLRLRAFPRKTKKTSE